MVVSLDDLTNYKGERGLHLSNVYIECDFLHDKMTQRVTFSYCYSKLNLSLINFSLFDCTFSLLIIVL